MGLCVVWRVCSGSPHFLLAPAWVQPTTGAQPSRLPESTVTPHLSASLVLFPLSALSVCFCHAATSLLLPAPHQDLLCVHNAIVVVFRGHYSKMHGLGSLPATHICLSQFWRREPTVRVPAWLERALVPVHNGHLLSVFSGGGRGQASLSSLFFEELLPLCAPGLHAPQSPHLLELSPLRVRISIYEFWGQHMYSDRSTHRQGSRGL